MSTKKIIKMKKKYNMNLELLKKEIPYKWRVQSFSQNKPVASCVAYIDARDVMDLLDEAVGAQNWTSDFKMVGSQMFAGIAIKIENEWVWKWDTGSETKVEAEKGEASDSFKRAGVKWGIGRFLYGMEIQFVDTNTKKTNGNYPYVVDKNGNRVWNLTEFLNGRNEKPQETIKNDDVKEQKREIVELLKKRGYKTDTAEGCASGVLFETSLELKEENYSAIIDILTNKNNG